MSYSKIKSVGITPATYAVSLHVHENELYSKIVLKLLATNFTI